MREGRILALGRPRDLISQTGLQEIWVACVQSGCKLPVFEASAHALVLKQTETSLTIGLIDTSCAPLLQQWVAESSWIDRLEKREPRLEDAYILMVQDTSVSIDIHKTTQNTTQEKVQEACFETASIRGGKA